LGRIGDRSAVKPLTKFLFHDDFQTRRLSVKCLAQLKDPSSGPALVRTFTDWDKEVRRVATDSLIAFGDERVIPILIRRLRGLKPWTREHAAQVLGGLKARQAIEPLKRALRAEPNETAAEAMIQALEGMGERVDEATKKRVEAQKIRGRRVLQERAKKKPIFQ
jgi:HEAT repeat protein